MLPVVFEKTRKKGFQIILPSDARVLIQSLASNAQRAEFVYFWIKIPRGVEGR